jgi:oligopeptide transport system substrate-binding protein
MKSHPWYLAIGLVLLAMVGCGEDVPEAEFVFVSGSKHNHFDPQRMHWMHDLRLISQVYDPLVQFDFEERKIEPATAESWEISDDRLTYTFHLREDAKWSNGDPVTAQDYLFAWRRALSPSVAANYTSFFYRIKGAKAFYDWRADQLESFGESGQTGKQAAEEAWEKAKARFAEQVGISAPDKRTLKVTLKQPVPYFLQLVAFPTFAPVHPASVKEATTIRAGSGRIDVEESYWSDPDRVVSNGPYVIAGRKAKRYVHLEANDHYYDRDSMRNTSILERIVTDKNNQLLTYENGKAHWLPDIPAQSGIAVDLIKQNRDDVHKYPLAGTYYYNFNCNPEYTLSNGDDNPLANKKVRKALAMAIDRKRIVTRVTQMNQPIANSIVPPNAVAEYDPPVEASSSYQPERAKELLAEAGYPNGKGLDGLQIAYNTGKGHGKIAQAVQSMWKKQLGVEVTTDPVDSNTFNDRLDSEKFSIARQSWLGDYPDPLTWLQTLSSESNNNHTGWSNEQYDNLLEQASNQHGSERMETLKDAERLMLEEQPIALFYHYVTVDVYDPDKVKGLSNNPWSEWHLEEVKVVESGASGSE